MKVTTRNPWLWVPTLYFAEGIPYFIVNNISVLMLAKMGVPNGQMALFTSLLYLPWMIKPFWSPFVDIIRTKRWWIIAMQLLMSLAFIMLTLCIPHPSAAEIASGNTPIGLFGVTLILFAITGVRIGHSRHSRRRFLYVGPVDQKPGGLCRHTLKRSTVCRRFSAKVCWCISPAIPKPTAWASWA